MTALLKHENQILIDQVVPLAGHAYINCTFQRCTILFDLGDLSHLNECRFDTCVWYVSAKIHDRKQAHALIEFVGGIVAHGLPRDPA